MPELSNWFEFNISETDPNGPDTRAVGRLLQYLADAMLASARVRLGSDTRRSGPRTAIERSLSAVRLVSVLPGSVLMTFRQPEASDVTQLGFDVPITADDVAESLLEDIRLRSQGAAPSVGSEGLRAAVESLLRGARDVGAHAYLSHRSKSGEISDISLDLRQPSIQAVGTEERRVVTLFGHTYMADVEPGRARLRVKLPNELDVSLDLMPEQVDDAPRLLDRAVRVEVEETLFNGQVLRRVVQNVRVLELAEAGPERPPKSIGQLAREQGVLLRGTPNYVDLVSSIWPTRADIEDFEQYVRDSRVAAR